MHAVSPSPSCLLLCCYLNIPLCPAHCFIQMIRLLCWIQRTLLLCRQANLFSQVSWCHVQLASEIKLLLVPTSFSLLSRVLSHEGMLQAALVFFKHFWLSLASEPPVWAPERTVSLCLFFKQVSFACSSHPWHLLNHWWSLAACTSGVSSQLFSMNIT